jgi:anti-anti-sigma regulatory factor
LVITGLNRSVTEVFRMVGFDVIFRTFPDVDEASRALQE